jgi:hypothetical protein
MAGTLFNLSSAGLTIANASPTTLLFVNPAAAPNMDVIFRRFWIGNTNNNAAAQVRVQLNTQVTTFPTLTSATPARLSNISGVSVITGGTAGAAGTCGVNATVEGGTKTPIWQDGFTNNNGWLLVLTPDEFIEASAGSANGLGVVLPIAVGASPATLNWLVGCTWGED